MRGVGTKKSNNGCIEISGNFDSLNLINGKGHKKWKIVKWEKSKCYPYNNTKIEEIFVYRGELKDT